MDRLQDFRLDEVVITDAYFANALEKEVAYLKAYDADRLVAGFYETKGLTPKAPKYPGWESTEIRGHTLGHYLTAIAQAFASTKDEELKRKMDYIVDELAICQFDSGYLSAFGEELFDNVENNQPCWVPWYTMDKIIAGLTACYRLAGNKKALQVVSKLADWVYGRTSKWTKQTQDTVLAVEYGGMNEAMYDLYCVTKKEEHAIAAHQFDEKPLFTQIHMKNDILNGKHANTTIPKFLGSLYRYIAMDGAKEEDFYFEAPKNFWDMVVENHTYVTGGNSEWEHFGEPRILDGERTNCNCETCNTYNMLKLSRELFKITKDKKYADLYENTFLNAIMSSQNPKTGMTMYFQPMATGYFKVYGTPFDSFWCCTGTGMENFTKCNDSLYFHSDDTLYVNQFISSKVHWTDMGVGIEQQSNIPNEKDTTFIVTINADGEQADTQANVQADTQTNSDSKDTDTQANVTMIQKEFTLALRIPDWAAGTCKVCVNGEAIQPQEMNGYVMMNRVWSDGDKVTYEIPMKITAHPLPDNNHVIGLKYGPVVLSAGLGMEDMEESKTGVDVTIATRNISIKDFITIPDGNVDEWIENVAQNVEKVPGKMEFVLKHTDSGHLVFTPHYRQHTERYGIYWNMVAKDSDALQQHILAGKEKARKERVSIDSIPLGNDQYELLHNIKGENTGAGTYNGLQLRHAWKDGWFSYDMKVNPQVKNYLLVKYFSGNVGREFNIYFDGVLYLEETIENVNPDNFYDKYYPIPQETIEGKDTIEVKFETRGDSWVGGIFDQLCIVEDYSAQPGLQELSVAGGQLTPAFDMDITQYTINAESTNHTDGKDTTNGANIAGAGVLKLKAVPCDVNGLVYVNGVLIDDTAQRELDADCKQVEIVVKGEDFATEKKYCITIK